MTFCACCGQPFQPRAQVPDQAYCPSPACQRARKRQWQRDKLQSDPDYRTNQRAAQRAWAQHNRDYWRQYRHAARLESVSPQHEQPAPLDVGGQHPIPAKMDVLTLSSGLYRITRHPAFSAESANVLVVEIAPLCPSCPCKMDVSREDVMDGCAAHL